MQNEKIKLGIELSEFHIDHDMWRSVLKEAFSQIAMAAPGEIAALIGPPRAGKTKMAEAIRKLLNPSSVAIDDPTSISIGLRMVNDSQNGTMTTKSFAQRALTKVHNPFFLQETATLDKLIKQARIPEAAYRHALEESIRRSGKKFIFIDEAQHMRFAYGRLGPTAIMDTLKNLAEETNTVLILIGTYELLLLLGSNGHVIGRSVYVHFPRYRANEKDAISFREILLQFEAKLKNTYDFSLLKHDELLFKGSLGRVGQLNKWIRMAVAKAIAEDSKLTLKHFTATYPSKSDLGKVTQEIEDGEAALSNRLDYIVDDGEVRHTPSETEDAAVKKNKKRGKAWTCKPVRRGEGDRLQGASVNV